MDRSLSYMEEIMDIYGIESSGGRLNTWRYGFDPADSH
ncbi:DUF4844 domain-containing protein [Vibrio cholerae]|nr:DUF4844 domain-containing protein [Vibrio cholerae]ELY5189552.1 DUF4844 domain-containing protein [Vibrio cholerae]ELY5289429.1 DUF4844 domain-containing protein [Vibrio cholerae]RBM76316.1 hypothetical protein DLR68_11060 [Vibrio paracholerae]